MNMPRMTAPPISAWRLAALFALLVAALMFIPPPPVLEANSPPKTPSSVTLTRADDTVTASGYAVSNATKYHITYTVDGGKSWHAPVEGHTNITTRSLTFKADNAKSYIVGVRAGNADGWSGWRNSPVIGPYTPPDPTPTPTPAPAPTLTAARSNDGSAASVSWTKYAGRDFQYYRVIVCDDSQYDGASCSGTVFKSDAIHDAGSTGPVTVTGLNAGTGYGVILQVWRGGSALKIHATLPAVPVVGPDAPANFTVTNGDGYYDLDWDAVANATAYDVRAKISNSNSWTSVATGVTATSYRYTTSNVVNVLAVRATNAGGAGPWAELSRMPSNDWLNVVIQGGASSQSAQAQSQLAAPASITVTRDNLPDDENLHVTWAAVAGAGGYNLACAATPTSNVPLTTLSWWHCGSVDSGSTTTFTVDKDKREGDTRELGYSRSYAVAVRAVTTSPADASPWLLSADAHPALKPDGGTMSVSRAAGSVSLSWTPPNHAKGYEIECAAYDIAETPTGPPTEPSYTLCADVDTATVTNGKISVTITSWNDGGNNYTVDDAKTYDIKVRTTNDWGESPDTLAPLIYPEDMLTVSDIGVTTETLNIAHYSGNWYYKADRGPHTRCQSAGSGSTKALTGLTAHTNYVYSAYSNSRCSSFRLLDTASFTAGASVSNLTNTVAGDSNIERSSKKAIAFTTGGNTDGYVLKSLTAKLKQKGSPVGSLTVTLRPMQGSGPYTKDSEASSTVLATLSGTPPTSTSWTDTEYTCSGSGCQLSANTTYFIVMDNADGSTDNANVWVWAYTLSGSETKTPSTNGWDLQYGHYEGSNVWRSYEDWHLAELVFANAASLTASSVTLTTATLTIASHTDVWYYKHTNAGATCDGPVAAGTSTKALTGLTAGTSYTFSAYSDSGCTTGNLLATAAQFTTLASVSNLTSVKSGNSKIFNQLSQAVAFTTGPNSGGYVLKSVTLPMKNSGSSLGLTLTLRQMEGSGQYSATSVPTATDLVTLTGTAPSGSDWTDTPFTCSGSGCDLSANTTYFVIAGTRNLSADQFGWAWAAVETETATPAGTGWSVGFSHYLSTAYTGWQSHSDWNIAEIVFATKA